MTVTATITFTLSPTEFTSIIETAGYGVGYWASHMESEDDDSGEFFKGCHFTEDETGKKFYVTVQMLEQAALDLYVKSSLNNYYRQAIASLVQKNELSDVGSDIAEVLIQQACFGEVPYG